MNISDCGFPAWLTRPRHKQKRGMNMSSVLIVVASILISCLSTAAASAAEEDIRQSFSEYLPQLGAIEEVSATPVPGLWEIRVGSSVLYSDASGRFVLQGDLIDVEQRLNLTQQRIDALTAFDFDELPFDDAVVWKQGSGSRKLVVFADPNCGFCKQFERELNQVEDITVYTFLVPILGGDSPQKSRSVWCAEDRVMAWRKWMLESEPLTDDVSADCDVSALQRNVALSEKHGVAATPTLVFENSVRVPGVLSREDLEKYFASID